MSDNLFISVSFSENERIEKLNNVIRKAVADRVADVHFQQTDSRCRIRFRMPGGALVDHCEMTKQEAQLFDDKIRSRARLSLTDRLSPLDGRISFSVGGVNIDVRVSITPGVNGGQLIVCRLLNQANSNKRLRDIPMPHAVREAFDRIINEPTGLVLVTGPTGSGKTTTLYALLNELNNESRNIITVENPVEYRIVDFHQIDVNGQNITFADALRSVLRQDPDVIMIGEIRDQETAKIAVQAANTGHLVLSTMHANNAPSAISRMMVDFGIDQNTLSAALRAVTAQRLIRTLADPSACPSDEPSDAQRHWLRANNINRPNTRYKKATGIDSYKGFVPVMEVILAEPRLKKAFSGGVDDIYNAASRQPQFETLAQAAERLAFSGVTTMEQACLVSSAQDAPAIHNRRLGQVLVESGVVSPDIMDSLLELQAKWRHEGNNQRLGRMLLEGDHCTPDDLRDAIGVTAEAQDILMRICTTGERKHALQNLVLKWTPGRESLFQMALDSNLVTFEELVDANTL